MINTKLEYFLEILSDKELAYFYTYRLDEFLSNSKNKIYQEISKRGLSTNDIDLLINTKKRTKNGLALLIFVQDVIPQRFLW